ncbi:Phospholipase/carboxylesterase [Basidiobolus meristosporus CBS 931.73]|uniref:Acyl-protein thioesterase 1 n=1 Tax=Basidiobolus meristosporus CBS 931.73 TaxID=1314790 RepID=A0A1Y1XY42_9FUNG|nr:Phospholipase/carboxylesterase [Basidiobolus meristosporus CBS 931.73]|eukprot:ORX90284.1 Phospholipase/carboxylesterase [Basidiobolus meristosporus CBS 931.73]
MSARALTSVIQAAKGKHSATVIFLHGLGDSGNGWAPATAAIAPLLPHVKFVLPNAPAQPVTLNFGMAMPSWYDIYSLDSINREEDEKGLLESSRIINTLIQKEIDNGIPANRIVLAGFSQGSAMSLLTGLTTEYKVAGIIGLSGYLPIRNKIFSMVSDNKPPIFMGHGTSDPVVQFQFGQGSSELLEAKGYNVEFHAYPGMAHSCCDEELSDMAKFLEKVIPPE